jgi:hypothetical protein
MSFTRYDYFYDKQIYRFLLQVVRAFSGFQYMTGRRGDIEPQLKLVPCKMAKRNRMVAMIQQNASENVMNTVPQIAIDLTNFRFDKERLQNPNHVSKMQVYERKKDAVTGQLTSEMGNSMTVERLMPRPFVMTCQIDLWTSNLDQKFQLMEQICEIIFPTFDIQNSDNALDWSAITTAHPQEDLTWSSVSVPVGNGTELDIATIQLEIPMWLSPPAKVKRQKIIEQVITNINKAVEDEDGNLISGQRMAQEVTTPGNHCIMVKDGVITLLGAKTNEVDADGDIFDWTSLLKTYGRVLDPVETQLRLRTSTDSGVEIIGTLQEVVGQPNKLFFDVDIDTLPANTLPAITAVIDPLAMAPGDHVPNGAERELPTAAEGQRYLLQVNDLPANTAGWGAVGARVGSIIQFEDGAWVVKFDPTVVTLPQYLVNLKSGKQLHWTGSDWAVAVEGIYYPGYWRIVG